MIIGKSMGGFFSALKLRGRPAVFGYDKSG